MTQLASEFSKKNCKKLDTFYIGSEENRKIEGHNVSARGANMAMKKV